MDGKSGKNDVKLVPSKGKHALYSSKSATVEINVFIQLDWVPFGLPVAS
jgi:hypothetical protein